MKPRKNTRKETTESVRKNTVERKLRKNTIERILKNLQR